MPHLFSRVLELPCDDETPVSVVEARDCFKFLVRLPDAVVDDVKVEVLEIVPGATKVLVRGVDAEDVPEVNYWRFRLPSTTVPEKAVASYEHDHLSVMIPKVVVSCNDNDLDSDETEEARMQRELLEDLESFGSPRRVRPSSPRSSSTSPRKQDSEDMEKLQHEVLEDLESFGSPRQRRNSVSCTQSSNNPDFFRSVGFWVGGFSVPVQ
jgi:HSP20 family molecular chaperone IbpA